MAMPGTSKGQKPQEDQQPQEGMDFAIPGTSKGLDFFKIAKILFDVVLTLIRFQIDRGLILEAVAAAAWRGLNAAHENCL